MRRAGCLLSAALAACLALGAIALFLSGPLTTRAVQNPKISLDMDPSGYIQETKTIQPSTVIDVSVTGIFACQGSVEGVRPIAFEVAAAAFPDIDARDPSPDIGMTTQAFITVIGTGPVVTPTPILPTPTATPGPILNTPTADPPIVDPASGGDVSTSAGGDTTVAQANVQTQASAVLAAALPKTGEGDGSESGPSWLLIGVAAGGLGMTSAAVMATRRLLGHR